MLLARLLDHLVRSGTLLVTDAYGQLHRFGDGQQPVVAFRLTDPALHSRMFFRPRLAFGEAYMDGKLVIETGRHLRSYRASLPRDGRRRTRPSRRRSTMAAASSSARCSSSTRPRAQRNVAHHYDLSGRLYELFLDRDRQYSCAYFRTADDDLEQAQADKKRHIAAKLLLRPGQQGARHRLGLGRAGALPGAASAAPTSPGSPSPSEQHKVADARGPPQAGLADRVRFELRDYREETGTLRPHRLGRHVRACRRRPLSRVLPQAARAADADDGVGAAAFDRPHGRARHAPIPGCASTSSPAAIRRRCPRSCRSSSEARPVGHRYRDPAAALRRDAARTGASASRANRDRDPSALRRALLPDVGVLPRRQRARLPPSRPHGLADAARQARRDGAADPRLHVRLGARSSAARGSRAPRKASYHDAKP